MTMKETLKQILIDFHSEGFPSFHPRNLTVPRISQNVRKGFVFIGMRRCGKTYKMYQYAQSLVSAGIDITKIVYLNFEDDRLITFTHEHFQCILDAYFELYPDNANDTSVVFILDEIHEIDGWDKFIRRLLDKANYQILLSGSSSKLLSKEISTTLRGRTMSIEVFPLTFEEHCDFTNTKLTNRPTSIQKSIIIHALHDYVLYGGFPERYYIEKPFFRNLLQGYIDVVIYRDIIERYNVKNPHLVREMLTYCLQNCTTSFNVLSLYKKFKSQGKSVSKNSLYEYMNYFEDAYCIYSIPQFAFSHHKRSINPKKIYTVDQGLITAYSIKPQFEQSMRLENCVFAALRQKCENLYYYKTRTNKEIDFVVDSGSIEPELYQVCYTLTDIDTAKREISSLIDTMHELNISTGTIITFDEEKSSAALPVPENIRVVPLWKWLCSL
ncbi:MAG: AAA family ATPase [Chitinivibrionales bacterium]|nr:AAA family ATPase [Chitinivibrionales bacterium]